MRADASSSSSIAIHHVLAGLVFFRAPPGEDAPKKDSLRAPQSVSTGMPAGDGNRFPATRWSIVLAARNDGDAPASRAAWGELCRMYWRPLYAFARHRGLGPEDAADATQSFFASWISEPSLADADPSQGRLRSFLVRSFSRDLTDRHRRATAARRGGGEPLFCIDLSLAESWHERLPADPGASPESHFDRQWALTLLQTCIEQLELEYASQGREDLFSRLRPFLDVQDPSDATYTGVVGSGLGYAAARQAVHRLRERFRERLRQHIGETLQYPSDDAIDRELDALRAALASPPGA